MTTCNAVTKKYRNHQPSDPVHADMARYKGWPVYQHSQTVSLTELQACESKDRHHHRTTWFLLVLSLWHTLQKSAPKLCAEKSAPIFRTRCADFCTATSILICAHAFQYFTHWLAASVQRSHSESMIIKCAVIRYMIRNIFKRYHASKILPARMWLWQLSLTVAITWLTLIIWHSWLLTQKHAPRQAPPIPCLWQCKNLE